MTIIQEKETADKKAAVQQVCTLLFPKHKVLFTPRTMILNGDNDSIVIDETNFEFLQQALTNICCLKTGPMDQQSFNPANTKAREIAEKLEMTEDEVKYFFTLFDQIDRFEKKLIAL